MIGKSLSFCALDIARSKVKESDVEKIIAGTRFSNADDLEIVIANYNKYYWCDYPDAADIARRLYTSGKIDQPRLRGEDICTGHRI